MHSKLNWDLVLDLFGGVSEPLTHGTTILARPGALGQESGW